MISREDHGPLPLAYVVAISHRPPREGDRALAVPVKLKRHLVLDERPSWVYTDEVNVFAWPGPDLRPADRLSSLPRARATCVIGPLPTDWFEQVLRHLEESHRAARLKVVARGR